MSTLGGDVFGELLDDRERIAGHSGAVVGMVFVDKSQGAVGLNAIGEVGVATRHQDEVALELAFGIDRSGAVDARVKAIAGAELGEHGAFSQELRGGGGHE